MIGDCSIDLKVEHLSFGNGSPSTDEIIKEFVSGSRDISLGEKSSYIRFEKHEEIVVIRNTLKVGQIDLGDVRLAMVVGVRCEVTQDKLEEAEEAALNTISIRDWMIGEFSS